jgi:hypothetical protein
LLSGLSISMRFASGALRAKTALSLRSQPLLSKFRRGGGHDEDVLAPVAAGMGSTASACRSRRRDSSNDRPWCEAHFDAGRLEPEIGELHRRRLRHDALEPHGGEVLKEKVDLPYVRFGGHR